MMEVESRISVQAIKGKFEQNVTPPQPRPRSSTAPSRNNTPSNYSETNRNTPKNSETNRNTPINLEIDRNTPKNPEIDRNTPKNYSEINRNTPKNSEIYRNTPKNSEIYRNTPKNYSEINRNTPKDSETCVRKNATSNFSEIDRNTPKFAERKIVSPNLSSKQFSDTRKNTPISKFSETDRNTTKFSETRKISANLNFSDTENKNLNFFTPANKTKKFSDVRKNTPNSETDRETPKFAEKRIENRNLNFSTPVNETKKLSDARKISSGSNYSETSNETPRNSAIRKISASLKFPDSNSCDYSKTTDARKISQSLNYTELADEMPRNVRKISAVLNHTADTSNETQRNIDARKNSQTYTETVNETPRSFRKISAILNHTADASNDTQRKVDARKNSQTYTEMANETPRSFRKISALLDQTNEACSEPQTNPGIKKTNASLTYSDPCSKNEKIGPIRVRGFSASETPSLFSCIETVTTETTIGSSNHFRETFESRETFETEKDFDTGATGFNSDSSGSGRPSFVKRIPVFKSFDKSNSEARKSSDNDEDSDEPRGIKDKIFTHIRSRSHGNFNIRRDQSAERRGLGSKRDGSVDRKGLRGRDGSTERNLERDQSLERRGLGIRDQSLERKGGKESEGKGLEHTDRGLLKGDQHQDKKGLGSEKTSKENMFHRDWLTPKRKQRSADNLLQDSSTFEGKQKLVANVVKNMNNNDKPNILKKSNFSSKIEKEMKNMKEKSITHENKGRSLLSPRENLKSKNKKSKNDTPKDKKKSVHSNPPVAIAREVADLALKKSGTVDLDNIVGNRSEQSQNNTVSIAREVADVALKKVTVDGMDSITDSDQRNSSVTGTDVENKLTVPVAPPSRPPRRRSGSHSTPHKKGKAPSPPVLSISPGSQRLKVEHDLSDDDRLNSFNGPPEYYSTESLISYNSAELSRENSPIMMGNSLSLSDIHGQNESKRSPNMSQNQIFDYEIHGQSEHDNSVDSEIHLPSGPPPKKPPRTFAYDIYKNFKGEESEAVNEQGNEPEKCTSPPIYAVPVKKKNKNNKSNQQNAKPNFIPKPPVRSKSDLSGKDIAKPSVAPKPAHVLAKAKRTSLVDPLGYEKAEELDLASEFQRQAHVRYSLRRPKKPPPNPPTDQNLESKIHTNTFPKTQNDSQTFTSQNSHPNDSSSFTPSHTPTPSSQNISNSKFPAKSDSSHPNSNDTRFPAKSDSSSNSNFLTKNDSSHPYVFPDTQNSSHPNSNYPNSNYSHQTVPPPSDTIDYQNIEYRTKTPQTKRRPHSNSCLLNTPSRHDYEDVLESDGMFSEVLQGEQPMSLGFCSVTISPEAAGFFGKRSMSDETLYKGSLRRGEEPVYATPMLNHSSNSSDHHCHTELHYMCSVLFTDEEEEGEAAGRDGTGSELRSRRVSKDKIIGENVVDGGKGRSGIISAWKREFRQSCRQVQNKIKKTVIR